MRPLTVLSVAFPLAEVGTDAVGGAEQVLASLDQALTAAGHHSVVVARDGSRTAGTLVPVPRAAPPRDGRGWAEVHRRHREAIARALDRHPVDVVHMHGLDFVDYVPGPGVPVLATLHLPPSWYSPEAFRLGRPATRLNCVSPSQRRACPPTSLLDETIENGVPVDRLASVAAKGDHVVALGRVCPEKGFHHALDAARRAGVRLRLAGRVFPYPEHERYYEEEIAPRLDADRRFLGPVGLARKRRLLTAARCLLVPSLAPETSSLVAMESLACGTPVVAFRSGALADIVEPGRTGFLVDDVQEMAEAIGDAAALDPGECRRVARERFSMERMTSRYLDRYRSMARRSA